MFATSKIASRHVLRTGAQRASIGPVASHARTANLVASTSSRRTFSVRPSTGIQHATVGSSSLRSTHFNGVKRTGASSGRIVAPSAGFSAAASSIVLPTPHGGVLRELVATGAELEARRAEAITLPTVLLQGRHICDLELLLNGSFSPLDGFMDSANFESVVQNMRLTDGTLWPLPITLDVSEKQAEAAQIAPGAAVTLVDAEGDMLAILRVTDVYRPDREWESQTTFGTTESGHAGANYVMKQSGPIYVGGRLEGLQLPLHYDYTSLRRTPRELRREFEALGWEKVVGFQTRNPMHRAHRELTVRAAAQEGAHVLVHPVVGLTKPGDVDHHTRVKCYKQLMPSYPPGVAKLALLNLAMRMGGPREALLHAIVRKNHGCSHFIVGRDHAGPGDNLAGNPFYGEYDAQHLVAEHEKELGIKMVEFQAMLYVESHDQYYPADNLPAGEKTLNISGTELRRRLRTGEDIPAWFSYPEVVKILRENFPSRARQGLTIFFTGLSGSGKSTIANALIGRLLEEGTRPVSLLDGDHVRTMLSSELGFSKEHRDLNITRIGYVASLVAKSRGIAVCAPIAPYGETRGAVRRMNEEAGGFIEIHVSTSLEECERRDRKGLYAKARAGQLKGMTGIDDPYEVPENPEITLDAGELSVAESVEKVVAYLKENGYLESASE